MGRDARAYLGYGFLVSTENAMHFPRKWGDGDERWPCIEQDNIPKEDLREWLSYPDDDDDEDVAPWVEALVKSYGDQFKVQGVGGSDTGETYVMVVARVSFVRAWDYTAEFIGELPKEPSEYDKEYLAQMMDELGIEGEPGWILAPAYG